MFSIFARFFNTSNKRNSIQTIKVDFDSNIPYITLQELTEKLNIDFNNYSFAKQTTFLNKDSILNNNDYINIFSK
jgi:hypothetical protein